MLLRCLYSLPVLYSLCDLLCFHQHPTDAIVNAANEDLSHSDGLAKAIREACGEEWQSKCLADVQEHGPVPAGSARACQGEGKLLGKIIINAVGPKWSQEIEPSQDQAAEVLASAVIDAMTEAEELKAKSISIPALTAGGCLHEAHLRFLHIYPQCSLFLACVAYCVLAFCFYQL